MAEREAAMNDLHELLEQVPPEYHEHVARELNAIAPNAIVVQRVQCEDSVTVVNGHSNLKVTQDEIEMKVL